MNDGLLQFGLTAFVTLLVVVDPFGVVPLFAGLTQGMSAPERRKIVTRAVVISLGVTIFFLLAGRAVLSHLGVTVHAFGISGGILLFATAIPMLFGQRPGLQAPERDERGTAGEDIAISLWRFRSSPAPARLPRFYCFRRRPAATWAR